MKIQLKYLYPNPYRDMDHYPINREKVETLKASIQETEFWDNILTRPKTEHSSIVQRELFIQYDSEHEGNWDIEDVVVGPELEEDSDYKNPVFVETRKSSKKYEQPLVEIAYGHHRLIALKEVYGEEYIVDVPVKEIHNAYMIKIMANENMESWAQSAAVINETVKVARDYLNGELAKADSWERVNESIKSLFSSPESFTKTKQTGVGQTTILKFLGGGWKQWRIQAALQQLEAIEKGIIEKEAVESLPNTEVAREFVEVVKEKQLDKKEQKYYAERINEEGIGKRSVKPFVRTSIMINSNGNNKLQKINSEIKKLDEIIVDVEMKASALDKKVIALLDLKTKFNSDEKVYVDRLSAGMMISSLKDLQENLNKLLST